MGNMLPRTEALNRVHTTLADYVECIGVGNAADCMGVSTDTVRRRLRGEQPWFIEEMINLAYHQWQRDNRAEITQNIIRIMTPRDHDTHPIRLPSDLRSMLRMVGRLTTEIAETLEDGRVDCDEARRLVQLLHDMSPLAESLRRDLETLIEQEVSAR